MRAGAQKIVRRSILVILAVLWSGPAFALHEESAAVTRLTSLVDHQMPTGRAWGNFLTFTSTEDLTQVGAGRTPGNA